jgi:hypothetical protein
MDYLASDIVVQSVLLCTITDEMDLLICRGIANLLRHILRTLIVCVLEVTYIL